MHEPLPGGSHPISDPSTAPETNDDRLLEHLASTGALIPAAVHDIRNPINVVKTSAYFLQTRLTDSDPRLLRHLELINRSCANMAQLLEDLVEYSRGVGPTLAPTSLPEVVQNALGRLGPAGARVNLEQEENLPLALLDPTYAALAVRKLLQWSLDRSPETSPVLVRIGQAAGRLRMVLEDSGPALSEEKRQSLFQPLVSAGSVHAGNLATALVTEVVRTHGGAVWCETLEETGVRVVTELLPAR